MSTLRPTATTAALCATLMLVAGCQSDVNDSEAQPLPPAESKSSTSPSKTSSPSPTETEPTEPAWQDKYSQKEIVAYEEALDRYATYEQRSEPIWRRGEATPAAEELFQEYFFTWQTQLRRLETYEQANVEIHGIPAVLDSRATRIELASDGQSVTIRQCVDFKPVATYQDSERAPSVNDQTREREIVLTRALGSQETPWRISGFVLMNGTEQC